ncbi:RHS repeat-associated core domain-containing protein [Mycoavidus sp. SF9855]|uniref:RHS repeat-associated core domain-containing protein n=1 Tax=Mycoavidus sp. SF9855 TaxID=2968475 RepID=UPI00211CC126|nr:RHS repeat-associated core domain-containing protein [Mycoavidus sp. SF9855]UUM22277.1 hypothetical protein NQD60_04225 [Mycoavidus sp. SF9855]
MVSSFLPALYAGTPRVSVCDNRGLAVRELVWRRITVDEEAEIQITRHQYNIRGQLVQSTDPRLYAARQLDDRVKPNFTWHYDLAGSSLRTESVDGGQIISLSDIEGRPLLAVTAMGVIQRWHYEDDTLPGRPLAVSELRPEQVTPPITERFIWAGNTQTEKDYNLVGQCVRHYDTAGLNRLDSLSLTGATLSQSRQLLADNQEANWEGSGEDTWQAMLAEKVYLTQSTTDATGAPLNQTDAMGNQQRLAYDVAGQLAGCWLTLADEGEQEIVKSLTYSAAGQKLREEHGNGVVTEYTYEPQTQRLTGITIRRPSDHLSGAKLLRDVHYEYDPVGNVVSCRDGAQDTKFWRNQKVEPENTYTYDTLYQLISAEGREMANNGQRNSQLPEFLPPLLPDRSVYTNYIRTYQYDLGGNLNQIRHDVLRVADHNYTIDLTVSDRSNRAVLSRDGLRPEQVDELFDAAGCQQSLPSGQLLLWNTRGELQRVVSIERNEGKNDQERYRYSGNGMRVLKINQQQTENTLRVKRVIYLPGLELRTTHSGASLNENLHVLTVGEAGGAQVRVLHWESAPPSGINNNQIRYSYGDLIHSAGLELDHLGEIISQEEYYPYGGTAVWMARSQIEASYKTVRYSGKERDATGLYYYGYRYYQPWVGRWLSADPAGTVDGLNLFLMVRNNPITLYDPVGLNGEKKSARVHHFKQSYSHKGPTKFSTLASVPVKFEQSPQTWHIDKQYLGSNILPKNIYGADRAITGNDLGAVLDTLSRKMSITQREITILTGTHGAIDGDNWEDPTGSNVGQRNPQLIEKQFLKEDKKMMRSIKKVGKYSDQFIKRINVVNMNGMTTDKINEYIKDENKHLILAYCYGRNDEALRSFRGLAPVTSYAPLSGPKDLLEVAEANVYILNKSDTKQFSINTFYDAKNTNFSTKKKNPEFYMNIQDKNSGKTHIVNYEGDSFGYDKSSKAFKILPNSPSPFI